MPKGDPAGYLPNVKKARKAGGYLTRSSRKGKPPITEDDPRWNAKTMGNKTGWHKGVYYENGKPARSAHNYKPRGRG